jgi:bifunctional UDP-N-acetylglucosamine pyrophosphorylase/glucosamine-1-phosphate N-acetyltransferase
MSLACVILAAGKGKRLNSDISKAGHHVGGEPMIYHVLRVAEAVGAAPIVVVVGHNGDQIEELLAGKPVTIVWQDELLGTGDAVRRALPVLVREEGVSQVLVLAGDTPLLRASTVERLVVSHYERKPAATVLTCEVENPTGYGRVKRDHDGFVEAIVEEVDATEEEKAIREINAGVYVFDVDLLKEGLDHLDNRNVQREYYLPKVLEYFIRKGLRVDALRTDDPTEVAGVNSRQELAAANKMFYRRRALEIMGLGVTIIDPDTVYIENDVVVGKDSVIFPMTVLKQGTRVGSRCVVGPGVVLDRAEVADGTEISFAVIRDSYVGPEATVGPYAHVRPGCYIKRKAKVGTFVELKKTTVGEGAKVPHLSYMGDATIGDRANIGAGSITCNYDGASKHQTIIGEEAFIGSDTMFVAPVTLGARAWTGAGSVITEDVPEESLAIARARQVTKQGWVRRKKMSA